MYDPSIAVAMLGAGHRTSRVRPARESLLALLRRWFVTRVPGISRLP